MEKMESTRGHITDEELAGYLDRSLPAGERDQIEGHLADCADCRTEMRVNARLLRPQKKRKHWYLGSSVLAAAALVVLVITNPFSKPTPGEPVLRGPDAPLDESNRLISAIAPEDGGTIDRANLDFVWTPIEANARYRFTLTNALGEDIWSFDTADTSLALPADVSLVDGGSYFWYVDALLLDGRSVTTGTRRFDLSR